MIAWRRLCRLDALDDPGARGFTIRRDGRPTDIFVARRGTSVYGYVNHCPHAGSPLDWVPEQFLSLDRRHIQCATHHALFEIDSGECLAGPCAGRGLEPVSLSLEDGWVLVEED
ncbi:Rieske (2Fe-2S) protein [Thiohalobacter sp. IOR34]|uniref:Rieske (2Fe-2S) protein n=1 Tax=Thiohalobacter sp. IOR34 TaxID=3057176 RepID=UPI0025AFB3FF|nr:Rieske (2Fe-2S) protein [Thiohalobacter sp. IOR34]WJW75834.1 Rieske (2Fe-2S) protein [Thiohalobacter sp. IOR34]